MTNRVRDHQNIYYLQTHGMWGGRMTVKGYGADNPVADNKTAEGRAHNRRVVLHCTNCNQ